MTIYPPALVLNADFRPMSVFPLSTLDWQESVRLVYQEKVILVAEYDIVLHSPSREMKLPSVIACRGYVSMPDNVAFTRHNVFLRDKFKCQYCGEFFSSNDLTFDHVVPRAKGGITEWTNIVASCEPCNTRKGHGAHMHPMNPPHKPSPYQLALAKNAHPPTSLHKTWQDYVYWSVPLEA